MGLSKFDSGFNLGGVGIEHKDINTLSPQGILDYLKEYQAASGGKAPKFTSGPGGSKLKAYWQAFTSAESQLGRPITSTELADIAPYFMGKSGQETGNQYLAGLVEAEKRSPKAMKAQAPQYADTINQMFNDLMARGATPAELEHLGTMMATGEIDPYEVQQFIQSTPEYQTAQTEKNVAKLGDVMKGYDTEYFKRTAPEIMSSYAKAGIQHSPALDYALTNLQSQIADKRGQYLAGLTYEGSRRGQDVQMQDYGNTMNQYLAQLDYERKLRDMQKQALQERAWGAADYGIQQRDWSDFYKSQQPPEWQQWLNTGLGVVNAASNVYGAFKGK